MMVSTVLCGVVSVIDIREGLFEGLDDVREFLETVTMGIYGATLRGY